MRWRQYPCGAPSRARSARNRPGGGRRASMDTRAGAPARARSARATPLRGVGDARCTNARPRPATCWPPARQRRPCLRPIPGRGRHTRADDAREQSDGDRNRETRATVRHKRQWLCPSGSIARAGTRSTRSVDTGNEPREGGQWEPIPPLWTACQAVWERRKIYARGAQQMPTDARGEPARASSLETRS